MRQLSTAISNPLEDAKIIISRLYNFAVFLRNKLISIPIPNPEAGQVLIALNNAINPVQVALDTLDMDKLQQKGLTIGVDEIVADFMAAIDENYYKISAIFAPKTANYEAFFPHGKSEYSSISRTNAEMLMNRMKTSTQAHVGALGTTIRDAFANFPTQFTTARNQQLVAIGTTDTSIGAKGNVHTDLGEACWKVFGFLIYVYGDDTATIESYYDESLLLAPNSNNHNYNIELGADGTRNIVLLNMTPNTTIEIECTGSADGDICLPPTPGAACAGTTFTVAAGTKHSYQFPEFVSPGATCIRVKNNTAGVGKYVVRVHI
ncbi:MAG: hypothetical protein NTX03_05135 [Bacteroidetes bacterium]|nr:hypothetical protein [Bacteroidota bacterium]